MLIFSVSIFRNKWLLVLCALSDIILLISARTAFSLEWLWAYLIVAVLFVLRQLIARYNYKTIDVSELKTGMILAVACVVQMLPSRIPNLPDGTSEDLRCRLTQVQVDAVEKWSSKNKVSEITIVRKIPFALFISLGYAMFVVMGLIR